MPDDELAVVRAEFDVRTFVGRQVIGMDDENHMEMLLSQGDLWGRPTVDGESTECWFHFSRGTSERARASAVLPGAYPLFEPEAVGFLKGGGRHKVVVDVLLAEAVAIAAPKMANQLESTMVSDASVRGVLTLAGGEYQSLEYQMADVIAELDRSDPGFADPLRPALEASKGSWTVGVEYSRLGSDVTVTAPARDRVIEAGSPDQILLSTEPPLCEAAR